MDFPRVLDHVRAFHTFRNEKPLTGDRIRKLTDHILGTSFRNISYASKPERKWISRVLAKIKVEDKNNDPVIKKEVESPPKKVAPDDGFPKDLIKVIIKADRIKIKECKEIMSECVDLFKKNLR